MKRSELFNSIIMTISLLFLGMSLCLTSFGIEDLSISNTAEVNRQAAAQTDLENTLDPVDAYHHQDFQYLSDGFSHFVKNTCDRLLQSLNNANIRIQTVANDIALSGQFEKVITGIDKLLELEVFRQVETSDSLISISELKEEKASSLWRSDYTHATREAEQNGKMLLIYFCDPNGECDCNRFKSETLDAPAVVAKLENYVCLQIPLDAKIIVDGKETVLLKHEAFKEMQSKPGIAVIDYQHKDLPVYGTTVSTFPLTPRLWYTPEKMAVILDLPPGTLTQRTMIYAVRTHPEKPASTSGEPNPLLFEEAQKQAQYQANIRVQGHQQWESRFQRISARLNGLSPREVCAESWPGENLVEAAIECVRCWRTSDGHWSAVRASQRAFGYDMKRGSNGIWYATGILGGR